MDEHTTGNASSGGYTPPHPGAPQPGATPPQSGAPHPAYTPPQPGVPQPPASQSGAPRGSVWTAVLAGAVAGLLMSCVVLLGAAALGAFGGGSPEPTGTVAPIVINPVPEDASLAEAVAAKVLPSVVNVTNMVQGVDQTTGESGFQPAGLGSGVIIRADGYILTNYHVVAGAGQLIVNTGVDGLVATVVGVDQSSDLAVIKVEGATFTPIDIGSSGDVVVGQWVMAVGSPFGLDQTVTTGIVSALQRSDIMADSAAGTVSYYTNLIQTDAAINPGNSGGALVDEQGRLIGINSLIESPGTTTNSAQSAGIGFAIPSDYAMMVANEIIETGKATHPFLGVSIETVDQAAAAQGGLSVQAGAIVTSVSEGSPAQSAGIQVGDVIIEMDGERVAAMEDVFAAVRSHAVGDTIEVVVLRNGETLTFSARLALNRQ